MTRARSCLHALFFFLAATPGCICSGQHIVCSLSGNINDPSNRTERRQIMSFAIGEFCKEMTRRNAPLKLADSQPVIGRFYPRGCTQHEQQNGDLYVQFDGLGYAWNAASKKLTFSAGATVQYAQDFKCADDDAMYAYFPPSMVSNPPAFSVRQIEAPIANLVGTILPGLTTQFGTTLLQSKLTEGFTVVREENGDTDFGIGLYKPPQRPQHPFRVASGSKLTYENLVTEVHQEERDFIGPILVDDDDKALWITLNVDGAPAVDVLVMDGTGGAAALTQYLEVGRAQPIPSSVLRPPPFSGVAQAGQQYHVSVPVSRGYWYVVIDNTSSAGVVNPPVSLLDDRAAEVSYVVQIGDAP